MLHLFQDGLLSCPSLHKLQQYPSEDSEFWCKIKLVVVQQLENNPKSITQPKVFPLHQFEFAKLVLVSGHWNTGAHIEARTNITGEAKPPKIFNRHGYQAVAVMMM